MQKSNDYEKSVQGVLLKSLEERVFELVQKKMKITLSWFIQDKDSRKYIIKEAYRLNIASLPNVLKIMKFQRELLTMDIV